MYSKVAFLRMLACAAGAVAVAAAPVAEAADGKARVHVQYSKKSVTKAQVIKARGGKGHMRVVGRVVPRLHLAGADDMLELTADGLPNLKSTAAMVVDFENGTRIFGKNTQSVTPIASITKLMTAMVVLDANLPLDQTVVIDPADFDMLKHTNSRLGAGTGLPRSDMLHLALMSSENRAAAALGRSYPGGISAFTSAMNRKAVELGMRNTRFVDSTGLSSENVSTAEDLVKMVRAAYQYPLIREFTTTSAHEVANHHGRSLQFRNSNGLVKSPAWEIGLSKTGYISEAGRCLVMQAKINARPVVIVLLDSWGKYTRAADANRIKKWLESHLGRRAGLG